MGIWLTGAELPSAEPGVGAVPGAGNGDGGDPASTLEVEADEDNAGDVESCGGVEEGAAATGGKGTGVVGLTEGAGGVAAAPAGAGTGLTVAVIGGKAAAVGEVADGVGEVETAGEGGVTGPAGGGARGSDARWPGKSLAKVLNETSPLSFPGDPTTLTMAGRLR